MESMNRGDLKAAVALYEPNAILVADSSGETLTGQAAIREAIRSLLALGLQMTRETRGAFVEAGVRYQGVRLRVRTVRTLRPRWVPALSPLGVLLQKARGKRAAARTAAK